MFASLFTLLTSTTPHSATVTGNNIFIDNELMKGKLDDDVIQQASATAFETITVGYNKRHLGTILGDLANHFQAPRTLDLDLFYASENPDGTVDVFGAPLDEEEQYIRGVFSKWNDSNVQVVFRCNELVIRRFNLRLQE